MIDQPLTTAEVAAHLLPCPFCGGAASIVENRPEIDKTRRILEKRAGVRKGRGFRGGRKFDGSIKWYR